VSALSPAEVLAREADLWRELADVTGRLAIMGTRKLSERHERIVSELRVIGVTMKSPLACTRFAKHTLITHEEAGALRAAILGGPVCDSDARAIDMVLGRIALELEPGSDDREPPTRPTHG